MHNHDHSSSRRPHSHHRDNLPPPKEYTDLRTEDIKLLAPLLTTPPAEGTSARSYYEVQLRQRIAELPSHLKCKLSKLSTFCSLHDKINPLPILSILEVIQDKLSPSSLNKHVRTLGNTFTSLQDMNAVWTKPADFKAMHGRPAFEYSHVEHRCAACKLAALAKDVSTLVALGGVVIANINPKNWKRSKRVQIMEEWIKAAVEFSYQAEGQIMAMWDLVVELSDPKANTKKKVDEGRSYIDAFVTEAEAKKLSPAHFHTQPVRHARPAEMSETLPAMLSEIALRPSDNNPFADEYQQLRTPTTAGFAPSRAPSHRSAASSARYQGYEQLQTPSTAKFTTPKAPMHASTFAEDELQTPTTARFSSQAEVLTPSTARFSTAKAPLLHPAASSIYSQDESEDYDKFKVAPLSIHKANETSSQTRRVASSIYSRAVDEDDDWDDSMATESEIVDSYRRRTIIEKRKTQGREFF